MSYRQLRPGCSLSYPLDGYRHQELIDHKELGNNIWKRPHFPNTGIVPKVQMSPGKLLQLSNPSLYRVQYKTFVASYKKPMCTDSHSIPPPAAGEEMGDLN